MGARADPVSTREMRRTPPQTILVYGDPILCHVAGCEELAAALCRNILDDEDDVETVVVCAAHWRFFSGVYWREEWCGHPPPPAERVIVAHDR